MKKNNISAILFLCLVVVLSFIAGSVFQEQKEADLIIPSQSLTGKGKLSDYFEGVKNTSGDADIYVYDSGIPGATTLLLGGTHPNEPAGFLAVVIIMENIKVEKGRIIIIPQANSSGFSHTDPMEGFPTHYYIQTENGERKFRIGSRLSNPLDQWPDPLVYLHYPSQQSLSGFESRNLNRSFPGKINGTFTEKIGYAIVQLVKKENVDIVIDLHEAAPEIPIINAIVYHPKCEDIALSAVLSLEMEDLRYAPEKSPENFRGLSHRELGDSTNTNPFLMETCNPIQGRLRGETNEELITKGISQTYKEAKESEKLRIEYDIDGEPLWRRVARHVLGFQALLDSYNEYHPDNKIITNGYPGFSELKEFGLGKFLNSIK